MTGKRAIMTSILVGALAVVLVGTASAQSATINNADERQDGTVIVEYEITESSGHQVEVSPPDRAEVSIVGYSGNEDFSNLGSGEDNSAENPDGVALLDTFDGSGSFTVTANVTGSGGTGSIELRALDKDGDTIDTDSQQYSVSGTANMKDNTENKRETRDYEPVLSELLNSDNPSEFAESRQIPYENGTVTVVLILQEGQEVPEGYSAEVTQVTDQRNETLAEIRLPVRNIPNISKEGSVRNIRAPSIPSTTDREPNQSDNIDTNPNNDSQTGDASPGEESDGFTVLLAIIAVFATAYFLRWSDE
jgi:hypothetical protein